MSLLPFNAIWLYVCCHSTLLWQNFIPSGYVCEPVKFITLKLTSVVLFAHFQKTHHLFIPLSTVTFSPGDDIIHLRGNSSPEVVIPWVVRLRLHVCLFTLLVKPPKLPTAEQVGFAIVGPDKGCLHPVHRHPVFSLHAPVGERPRVSGHGHCVLEDPVLRSLTESVKEN